ncbi:acetylajmalan esterase-like [Silene latifolia]|uniref:acetylajmalan esterase-like n=1 Tax=Silene latifolia TaxID=37657 RepID=UPI003D77853B
MWYQRRTISTLVLSFIYVFVLVQHLCNAGKSGKLYIDGIYQLGDSLSDTGNLMLDSPKGTASICSRLPYGSSLSRHPTGRCSNGLLIIDFIAKAAGIPLVKPSLTRDEIFRHGESFAFAGATALTPDALKAKGITNPVTNSSFGLQSDYLWSHLEAICYNEQDCKQKLKNAIFIIGEVGRYDYYYALSQGKTFKDVNSMVVDVVHEIAQGVRKVVQSGASKVIVPGIFQLSQFPAFLSASSNNYRGLNSLSILHNNELQKAIQGLKKEQLDATIVYADYYSAFASLLKNAPRLGFNATSDLKNACCGTGGRYNYDPTKMCGTPGVSACSNPDGYVIWDGINLTENAYKYLAQWIISTTISRL